LQRISEVTQSVEEQVQKDTLEIQDFLRNLDMEARRARLLLEEGATEFAKLSLEEHQSRNGSSKFFHDWKEVRQKALKRGIQDLCSICISPFYLDKSPQLQYDPFRVRKLSLLSCSHLFHTACLKSFERFGQGSLAIPVCPICRSPYQVKEFEDIFSESSGTEY
jgi:hypothetical protein